MTSRPELALLLPFKSLTTSLLFSVFLGPLGLLYATTRGGILMLIIAFVLFSCRFPVPILLMWLSCSVWAVFATNRYNHQLLEMRMRNNHEEKNHSSTTTS